MNQKHEIFSAHFILSFLSVAAPAVIAAMQGSGDPILAAIGVAGAVLFRAIGAYENVNGAAQPAPATPTPPITQVPHTAAPAAPAPPAVQKVEQVAAEVTAAANVASELAGLASAFAPKK